MSRYVYCYTVNYYLCNHFNIEVSRMSLYVCVNVATMQPFYMRFHVIIIFDIDSLFGGCLST